MDGTGPADVPPGVRAGLGGLALAVFLGGTTGLVLYLVLVKVLAHLS